MCVCVSSSIISNNRNDWHLLVSVDFGLLSTRLYGQLMKPKSLLLWLNHLLLLLSAIAVVIVFFIIIIILPYIKFIAIIKIHSPPKVSIDLDIHERADN